MAFERISDNFGRLNDSIRAFAASSAEYYKLNLFHKTMKGATAAVKSVAIAFFLLFSFLFLSIAIAVALSNWIDSPSSGFFIVGGIYLLIGLFIIFFGSAIINRVLLKPASRKFFNQDEKQSKQPQEFKEEPVLTSEEIIIKEDERV